eukprot:3210981-Prymnesium_polylepis.1
MRSDLRLCTWNEAPLSTINSSLPPPRGAGRCRRCTLRTRPCTGGGGQFGDDGGDGGDGGSEGDVGDSSG